MQDLIRPTMSPESVIVCTDGEYVRFATVVGVGLTCLHCGLPADVRPVVVNADTILGDAMCAPCWRDVVTEDTREGARLFLRAKTA